MVQLNGTCVILKQLEMHPKSTKKSTKDEGHISKHITGTINNH